MLIAGKFYYVIKLDIFTNLLEKIDMCLIALICFKLSF